MRFLLIISAVIEVAMGASLLILPSLTASGLLGVPIDTPVGLVAGRMAGAALAALGIACWNARSRGPEGASNGVVMAMLYYNVLAVAVLVHVGIRVGLVGPLLWPAILLHLALGAWCLLSARSFLKTAAPALSQE